MSGSTKMQREISIYIRLYIDVCENLEDELSSLIVFAAGNVLPLWLSNNSAVASLDLLLLLLLTVSTAFSFFFFSFFQFGYYIYFLKLLCLRI